MQPKIERSYLGWVSREVFPTIDAFDAYAKKYGAIRRIPNENTASELSKPGTVLYLAHGLDGNRSRVCGACCQMIQCPVCEGRGGTEGAPCERCRNHGMVEMGTGGVVEVDGVRWPYTKWIRLRRAPKHAFWLTEHKVGKAVVCKNCGGRGRVPMGAVFAAIVPTRIMVVARDMRNRLICEQAERHHFGLIKESDAMKAWPGTGLGRTLEGLYAVADKEAINGAEQVTGAIVEALKGRAEVCGGYVKLIDPIAQQDKRFIGIKRWQHPAIDIEAM